MVGVAGLEEIDATGYGHTDGETNVWNDGNLGTHSKYSNINENTHGQEVEAKESMTGRGSWNNWSGGWDNDAPEVEDVE